MNLCVLVILALWLTWGIVLTLTVIITVGRVLHLRVGCMRIFGSLAFLMGGDGLKIEDKYRGLTDEEREEEQRKLDAWADREERGPGYAAPLCGNAAEIDAYRA